MKFYVRRTNTVNTGYEENELFDTEIKNLIDIYEKQLKKELFKKHQHLLTPKIMTLKEEQQMRIRLQTKINFKNQQKREIGHVIRLTEQEEQYTMIKISEQDYYARNNSSQALI